jgi:predicted nucleotidyltransferase
MFTVERRQSVRALLIDRAREDPRIVGAAITGSAARDAEDRWSDVDLFFGISPGNVVAGTLGDWSEYVYRELGALHHFDLRAGPAVYRAFLLEELLEIDLGFVPVSAFGPRGDGEFRVVFGDAVPRQPTPVDPDHLTGLAWHHVLHARICIERGAVWQAEYWISALRDNILTLACHRLGRPIAYVKGADHLPVEITGPVSEALVRRLEVGELSRALDAATRALLGELRATDPEAATSLEAALRELADVRIS